MPDKVPIAFTPEYLAELKVRVENVIDWSGPVSRLDILTLLAQIAHLEKEADWLAKQLSDVTDHAVVKAWREAARINCKAED